MEERRCGHFLWIRSGHSLGDIGTESGEKFGPICRELPVGVSEIHGALPEEKLSRTSSEQYMAPLSGRKYWS